MTMIMVIGSNLCDNGGLNIYDCMPHFGYLKIKAI